MGASNNYVEKMREVGLAKSPWVGHVTKDIDYVKGIHANRL